MRWHICGWRGPSYVRMSRIACPLSYVLRASLENLNRQSQEPIPIGQCCGSLSRTLAQNLLPLAGCDIYPISIVRALTSEFSNRGLCHTGGIYSHHRKYASMAYGVSSCFRFSPPPLQYSKFFIRQSVVNVMWTQTVHSVQLFLWLCWLKWIFFVLFVRRMTKQLVGDENI